MFGVNSIRIRGIPGKKPPFLLGDCCETRGLFVKSDILPLFIKCQHKDLRMLRNKGLFVGIPLVCYPPIVYLHSGLDTGWVVLSCYSWHRFVVFGKIHAPLPQVRVETRNAKTRNMKTQVRVEIPLRFYTGVYYAHTPIPGRRGRNISGGV